MANFRQSDVQDPHFKLPFQFGGRNGGALVNEQDSADDIMDCVRAIVAFPIGSRQELSGFGIPDPTFRLQSDETVPAQIWNAIILWEDRAVITVDDQPIVRDEYLRQLLIKVGTSDG